VRRQKRDLADTRTKIDRRVRYGQKMQESGGVPRIVAGNLKRRAQVSAGKLRGTHIDRLDEASKRLAEAEEALRDDAEIRVDLPQTSVPAARDVLTLSALEVRYGARADLIVRGPERIALTGPNGAGKTTLLRTITGEIAPVSGELFRAGLATLLLAEPPPQLLLLDEPTNSLDMASVRQLSGALRSYQGALIVASHDVPFLRDLGITRWLGLDGELTDIDAL